jgi:hypothetical protein
MRPRHRQWQRLMMAPGVFLLLMAGLLPTLGPPHGDVGALRHYSGQEMDYSAHLPLITHKVPPCATAGQLIYPDDYRQGVRCCPGLRPIEPASAIWPCDTPGVGECDMDGCWSVPCYWSQCTPCGNSICEPDYGENRCNCKEDCKP